MKREIRQNVLNIRAALTPGEVDLKSRSICDRIVTIDPYRQASTVMVYLDFRNEVSTKRLVEHALAAGKRVVIPVTDRANKRLLPSEIKNFPEDLAPGTWGILEPKPGCYRPVDPSEIEMVVVPGVAFDLEGNRVGYGGGFYDRFLPLTAAGRVTLAPAYEFQIKDCVYPGKYDQPVDYLVTEQRVIKASHN